MVSLFFPLKLLSGLLRFALSLLVLLACALTAVSFLGFTKSWEWSLASHFIPQYLAIQLIALLVVSFEYWQRSRREETCLIRLETWVSLVVLGVFAGLNLTRLAPYYLPSERPTVAQVQASQRQDSVKLMHFNLFGIVNRDTQAVVKAIRAEDPDLLDLVEYTPEWQRFLEKNLLQKRYPYRVARGRNIALYSKRPLTNGQLVFTRQYDHATHTANIVARFRLNREAVTLLVAHPASPVAPSHLQWLRQSFAQWKYERPNMGKNLIIVGDLNTTPWSMELSDLLKHTGLRDSALGYGIQASWPMILPAIGVNRPNPVLSLLMGIPIDHVLVSQRLMVLSRHTGPFVGSDHLPVTVELSLKPDNEAD